MSSSERNKQLRIVSELLLVHVPAVLDDQQFTRDLLCVIGVTLRAAWEDAEKSARAWDKKAYDVKADHLRDEWAWAMGAANYAEGLAYRVERITSEDLGKLRLLIRPEFEPPARKLIKHIDRLRGAAQGNLARQQRERSRTPRRSLV
jgi:hypothetical protein